MIFHDIFEQKNKRIMTTIKRTRHIGGFIIDPELKKIIHIDSNKDIPYSDFKDYKKWDVHGHTIVWYKEDSNGKEWFLTLPSPIREFEPIRNPYKGRCYITGKYYSFPGSSTPDKIHFLKCGFPPETISEGVEW